jgi:hypothetical protein
MRPTGSALGRVWPESRTMDKPEQERRNEARRRALKGAQIVFNGHEAVIDCVVRNLSDLGACPASAPMRRIWRIEDGKAGHLHERVLVHVTRCPFGLL